MRSGKFLLYVIPIVLLTCACGPAPDIRTLYETDCRSPQLKTVYTDDAGSVTLEFDEPAAADASDIRISPDPGISSMCSIDEKIVCTFRTPLKAGSEYIIEGCVSDSRGNTLDFMGAFYGRNTDLPVLLVNEFACRGSGTHPDSVELIALSGGNPAGIVLCDGTTATWKSRFILPDMRVQKGDFLVIHFKPQGIPGEKDETTAKNTSDGYDASDTAYDFWVKGGTGLSSNNGVLVLYENPAGGKILDCVVYSDRTSASDTKYGGFGSSELRSAVETLSSAGAWTSAGKSSVPEDAVGSEGSTGTRSICRNSKSTDSNAKRDWYIVDTKCATFGSVNSDTVYAGK